MTARKRNAYKISVENLKGRNHSEDLGVDWRIILEWILGKLGGKMWTGPVTVMNTATDLRVPHKTGNFLTSWATVSFSRTTLLPVVSYNRAVYYPPNKNDRGTTTHVLQEVLFCMHLTSQTWRQRETLKLIPNTFMCFKPNTIWNFAQYIQFIVIILNLLVLRCSANCGRNKKW